MAHFKLDPAFLDEHRDVKWLQDDSKRDSMQKNIFLHDVLPRLVGHQDDKHAELDAMVEKYSWLRSLAISPWKIQSTPRGYIKFGKLDVDELVHHLKEEPLANTLLMADLLRLERCYLLNEYMSMEAPWYYAFGQAHTVQPQKYLSKTIRNVRAEVRACMKQFPGYGWNLNDGIWQAEDGEDDEERIARRQRFISETNENFKETQTIVYSEAVNSLRSSIKIKKEGALWEAYKAFDRWDVWEQVKVCIREACLRSGSPVPHENTFENIAELRKHLSSRNDYYTTIATLNKKLETQQRIITNLSFRHLLESLPGGNKDGKTRERDNWERFWGRAMEVAEFEKNRQKETNREFEKAWRTYKLGLAEEKTNPKKKQQKKGQKAQKSKAVDKPGNTEKTEKETPTDKVTVQAPIVEVSPSRTDTVEGTEEKEPPGGASQNEDKDPEKTAEDERLEAMREKSPLVAVLKTINRDNDVRKEGIELYGKLSKNIHQYRQVDQNVYDINMLQWDALPYCLLDAMRPKNWKKSPEEVETGEEDWPAEKKRYVVEMFVEKEAFA